MDYEVTWTDPAAEQLEQVIRYIAADQPVAAAEVRAGGQELPAPEGWVALNQGDAARAAGIFREALERSPRDPVLHFGAGWAAYALGRNDAAIGALKRALEYDASFVQAARLLGVVAYANSDLDLAIRSMEKAAALAPRDVGIQTQLEQWLLLL